MDTTIACTLTSAGLAAQRERWQRLAARALIERAETPQGLRIRFRPEPGAEEELRELVAVEQECCAWARWSVEIALDVHSTGEGITTLHGMFHDLLVT